MTAKHNNEMNATRSHDAFYLCRSPRARYPRRYAAKLRADVLTKEAIMADIFFNGERYHDDRLFVLHICKCTVEAIDAQTLETVIYHDDAPAEYLWCLVTYRNTLGYPAVRVDHFQTREEARDYMERTEPTVPLISLDGSSSRHPLPYVEFVAWKAKNGFKEYDYQKVNSEGGKNHREVVFSRRR